MLAEVKKCAEAHDIKGLRYIFLDCLDVDPTFEKYREDYEYCKSLDGLFESFQPLNGISMNKNDWTADYWEQLKIDLMKNFSVKRFEHMIDVAGVVYAHKIARLLNERSIVQKKDTDRGKNIIANENVQGTADASDSVSNAKKLQEERIAEMKRELAENYQRDTAKEAADKAARRETKKCESANSQNAINGESESKKVLGIVLVVLAVVAIVLMIMVLH